MTTRAQLIYTTPTYAAMQRDIIDVDPERFVPGEVERSFFPDGERYQRVEDDVRGRDVVVLGGTVSDTDTLRIFDLACTLVSAGAHALTLVIPYFGYATMERAVKPGEVVTAKARARLLSAIPTAPAGNRVIMIDLHAPGIPHYFEGGVRAVHLYAKPITMAAIKALAGDEDFCLASPDAGRAKWVESLANDLGVQAAFVLKRRLSGSQTDIRAINADVGGKRVIIYDDMIRSGSTLLKAAEAYLDAGATDVAAVATHGVFPGNAIERLEASGLLTRVACTDTHPNVLEAEAGNFLKVYSVAGLIAKALG